MTPGDIVASELKRARERIKQQKRFIEGCMNHYNQLQAENQRLREVLRALYGTCGVTKAWQRKWPNTNAAVLNILREADHDPR